MVEEFANAGAVATMKNHESMSPLDVAIKYKTEEVVGCLLACNTESNNLGTFFYGMQFWQHSRHKLRMIRQPKHKKIVGGA